jgi:flagellar FliJ protein
VTRPFVFRLERLHWLRQLDERRAQEGLADSLNHRGDGERLVRDAESAVEGAHSAARATAAAPSTGSDLVGASAYLERVAAERTAAVTQLEERDVEVERRRGELSAAAGRRQALDRLRDRRRAEHEHEQQQAEGAMLDELALAAHRRGGAAA